MRPKLCAPLIKIVVRYTVCLIVPKVEKSYGKFHSNVGGVPEEHEVKLNDMCHISLVSSIPPPHSISV